MSGSVISLFARPRRARDWTDQELAEFYRVQEILTKSGIGLDTDRGLSDEGDPWFAFCRGETGEVIVHFARFDGLYVIGITALGDRVLRGQDFRSLIDAFLSGETDVVVIPQTSEKVRRLVIHPNALMVAFVATILLLSDGLKGSAAAMDSIADQAIAPSSAARAPFFQWAQYQSLINRGSDSERSIAVVAAAILASIAANEFKLFDQVGSAALDFGRLSIFASQNEADSFAKTESSLKASQIHAADAPGAAATFELLSQAGPHLDASVEAASEAKLDLASAEPATITGFNQTSAELERPVWTPGSSIVDQVLPFLPGLAQESSEAHHSIYDLAVTLIRDFFSLGDDVSMAVAPADVVAALNRVIHSAGLFDAGQDANSGGLMLDQGALVFDLSAPVIDAVIAQVPQPVLAQVATPLQTASVSEAAHPSSLTGENGTTVFNLSINTPIIAVNDTISILSELRAFLTVAQGVDLVIDNDTMVFVDQSDLAAGTALTIGSAWHMSNDLTVMVVGSVDTIQAYHDSIAPVA